MGEQAEGLGCHVFTGSAADGSENPGYQAGYELRAPCVIFAEGCRGSLGKEPERRYGLREQSDPQHYGIGLKEVWNVDPAKHRPGTVVHTFGWPLDNRTEGGGFLYHAEDKQVYLGFVIALNYENPHLDPFAEFQRWKHHPRVRPVLEGGEQSSPRDLTAFQERVEGSWVWEELHRARNFSPGLHRFGTMPGAALAYLEHNVLLGRTPFTLHNRKPDHECLVEADKAKRIDYPRPDGAISFDKLSSVFVSNTNHEEDQPCHLKLDDSRIPVEHNLPKFDEPAQRYCPAAVYEIVVEESSLSIGQM